MDFEYNDEQRMLADTVARWLESDYSFEHFRRRIADVRLLEADWGRLGELGLLGLNVPEADGGLGAGPVETLIVMQAFGRALAVEPFVSTAVAGVSLLDHDSAGGQHRGLLGEIAGGSCRVALAALEPESRYDLARICTEAAAVDGGFLLSGRKAVVLDGDGAGRLIVSARTAGPIGSTTGISLFVIDGTAPGVSVRGFPTIDGKRAAEISFDRVSVAPTALLGPVGAGYELLECAVDRAIAALCAEAVGAMEKLVELTAEHLRTRKQFGRPIGQFQALQHRIADMAVAAEQARSMALLAAARAADSDPIERRRAISAAKAMVGRSGRFVGQQAVQLHGGMGMTDELPVGYYFKRLTCIDLTWGNVEHHVERYGDLL
ncbi:MAG: acyl-CoA dehydrogenase family protein [Steroidobacteraceae bacterium]